MSNIQDNDETVTPAPLVTHDPPSLPASPLPKRTKVIEPTTSIASVIGTTAQTDSGTATPTPLAPMTHHSHSTGAHSLAPAASIDDNPKLQVQLLSDKARAPTKGSAFAAGHDLYSAKDLTIPARGRALVPTDIKISCPAGTYGRVAPRSGLAFKHGIDTMAGVIDADYRGPVGVILANLSDTDFEVKEGDRIAQLVLERIYTPDIVVVDQLEETVRGAGGFGSTGGFGVANGA